MNKQILLLQKSVQQLAAQGEMYLSLSQEWRPDRKQFVQRVLEETLQAVGAGCGSSLILWGSKWFSSRERICFL